MARGRCAGCGHEDVSSVKVRRHIAGCEKFAILYRDSPEKALDPEVEMDRWKSVRDAVKGEARAEKTDKWREFQERRAEQAHERWAEPTKSSDIRGVALTPQEVEALEGACMWGVPVSQIGHEKESLTPTQQVSLAGFMGEV